MVQEVIEIARGRHGPQETGVHEGLIQDREALLRAVDVSEVKGVDLAPGRLPSPPGFVEARLSAPSDRSGSVAGGGTGRSPSQVRSMRRSGSWSNRYWK